MRADELNEHIGRAVAGALAEEEPLARRIEKLLVTAGYTAADNFTRKTVDHENLTAAGEPKKPATWTPPHETEVLDTHELSAQMTAETSASIEKGLGTFVGELPTCVTGVKKAPAKAESTVTPSLSSSLTADRQAADTSQSEMDRLLYPGKQVKPDYQNIVYDPRAWEKQIYSKTYSAQRWRTRSKIAEDLSSQLSENPDWQHFVERMKGTDITGIMRDGKTGVIGQIDTSDDAARYLVEGWAAQQNSTDLAQLMQRAIADQFKLGDASWGGVAGRYKGASDLNALYERDGAALRAFTQAVYDNTQKAFADAGITEVTVYRGMTAVPDIAAQSGTLAKIGLQPGSSFTTQVEVAQQWAGLANKGEDGALLSMRVPASRIFSTIQTGIGAMPQAEVVVLGLPGRAAEEMWVVDNQQGVESSYNYWRKLEALNKSAASAESALPAITDAQTSALSAYAGNAYEPINNALREGTLASLDKETQLWVSQMDEAFKTDAAHFFTSDVKVYRAIHSNASAIFGTANPASLVGKQFTDDAFMSASMERFDMNEWVTNDSAAITIEVPKGSPAISMQDVGAASVGSEEEILLPRGTTLQIVSATKDAEGVWEVTARVVTKSG